MGLLSLLLWNAPSLVRAQAVAEPSFEVVSIRPSGPGTHGWNMNVAPDRVALMGANARTLVADAYGLDMPNVVGGPAWIDSEQYDVTATFDDSVVARLAALSANDRRDQIFRMLRTTMEQRFGLRTHHEARQVSVYALVLAKGGPKFGPAAAAADEAETREGKARYNGHLWTVHREPMTFLALQLSRIPDVGRNVIDRTGLKGDYRFNFDWSSTTDPDVSVFTAIKEQLGLTLDRRRAPSISSSSTRSSGPRKTDVARFGSIRATATPLLYKECRRLPAWPTSWKPRGTVRTPSTNW